MDRILYAAIFIVLSIVVNAQETDPMKYRRNSLSVSFIDDFSTTNSDETRIVRETMNHYQISDKYNDHSVGEKIIGLSQIPVTQEEIDRYYPKGKFSTFMNALAEAQGIENAKSEQEIRQEKEQENVVKLYKYIKTQHIPGLLVAKWFNLSKEKYNNSYFNMDLILERGAYNATELEKMRSDITLRGRSIVEDAGLDLIPNTFVVFSTLEYITAQEMLYRTGKAIRDGAGAIAGVFENEGNKVKSQTNYQTKAYRDANGNIRTQQVEVDGSKTTTAVFSQMVSKGVKNTANKMSKSIEETAQRTSGYYVTATTYLFKLKWDENSVDEFFSKYYESENPQSIIYNDLYELEYLGNQTSYSNVTQSNTFAPSGSQNIGLIERATIRAIDQSLVLLQKEHEEFRVKAPIIDVDKKNVTAFIGTKEGINSSAKFEVLEQRYNEKNNTYRYVRVGTLKVEKKKIWDNRFNLPGLPAEADDPYEESIGGIFRDAFNNALAENGIGGQISGKKKESDTEIIDRTYFSGKVSNIAPGMLIRQIK